MDREAGANTDGGAKKPSQRKKTIAKAAGISLALLAVAEQPAAREQTTGGEQSSGSPVQVSSGQFRAFVYRQEDGAYTLRLENFEVENGPDPYVYAVAAEDANDVDTVLDSSFLDLGRLKGNQGDQSYALPADFVPEVHRAISVWCKRFTANFAAAPLR